MEGQKHYVKYFKAFLRAVVLRQCVVPDLQNHDLGSVGYITVVAKALLSSMLTALCR